MFHALRRALLAWIGLPAVAVAEPHAERLLELAAELEAELARQRPPLYEELRSGSSAGIRGLDDAQETQLQYIRDTGAPVYYATLTVAAAQTISTDDVWPGGVTGYDLDGSGTVTEMAMWDGGDALWTHETMIGRLLDRDGPSGGHPHVTWVAGVLIAAGGFNPLVQGMSFTSRLSVYDASNDAAEMAVAAASGLRVSNHSYEIPGGWRFLSGNWYWFGDLDVDPNEDYGFGYYGPTARTWDEIAYNAPEYFIQKGCGNDRNDGPTPGTGHFHWNNQLGDYVWSNDTHDLDGAPNGYDCVSWFGNAKNIVSVGAVEDIPGGYTQPSDVVPTSFTSFGPCDDGRIKPDVTANGSGVWTPDWASNSAYAQLSGTSLSGPCVAGSANLLREFYESELGATPRAATLKALVLHTADEAGPADGPDYQHGWGLMNTRVAADHIKAGSGRFREAHLDPGEEDLYVISIPTARDVRVTLVWTDPPGTPAPPSVDPPDRMLVHDLDLRLTHTTSGLTHEPWVLDGANPTAPATHGDNVVDNVERVDVSSAPAGTYLVSVSAKGGLDGGQSYSLVASEEMTEPVATDVSDRQPSRGGDLALSAAPSPFVSATTISFTLSETDHVRLRVFDVAGRAVATLLEGRRKAGSHRAVWDGRDGRGLRVTGGTYFVRLETRRGTQTRKAVFLSANGP